MEETSVQRKRFQPTNQEVMTLAEIFCIILLNMRVRPNPPEELIIKTEAMNQKVAAHFGWDTDDLGQYLADYMRTDPFNAANVTLVIGKAPLDLDYDMHQQQNDGNSDMPDIEEEEPDGPPSKRRH